MAALNLTRLSQLLMRALNKRHLPIYPSLLQTNIRAGRAKIFILIRRASPWDLPNTARDKPLPYVSLVFGMNPCPTVF